MNRWLSSEAVSKIRSCAGPLFFDEEGVTIVSTVRRLEHRLWNGVPVFNPEARITSDYLC